MSIADEILAEQQAKGLARKPVKAWGKDLWAWELTAAQKDVFEASRVVHKGSKMTLDFKGSRARLVIASLRVSGDEGSLPVFTEEHFERLSNLGGIELDRVYMEAARVCGILAGDDGESMEDAARKN